MKIPPSGSWVMLDGGLWLLTQLEWLCADKNCDCQGSNRCPGDFRGKKSLPSILLQRPAVIMPTRFPAPGIRQKSASSLSHFWLFTKIRVRRRNLITRAIKWTFFFGIFHNFQRMFRLIKVTGVSRNNRRRISGGLVYKEENIVRTIIKSLAIWERRYDRWFWAFRGLWRCVRLCSHLYN